MSEFPGNSQMPKRVRPDAAEPKRKQEPVVQGEVVRRKKPLSKRLTEIFVGQSPRSAMEFVTLDVLIPAAKDAIADAVSQGFERIIFGESRSRSRRGGGYSPSSGYNAYNRYAQASGPLSRKEEPRYEMSRRGRSAHDFDEIILPTRAEADEVLERLVELVQRYGAATVGDLYDLAGIESKYTDEKWGWRTDDLNEFGVGRTRGGYVLNLPRPENLE